MFRHAAFAFLCLFTLAFPATAQTSDPQNTIILETTKGRVVIELLPKLAPKQTLSTRKIVEINITEIQIVDTKFIEMQIAEFFSIISTSLELAQN